MVNKLGYTAIPSFNSLEIVAHAYSRIADGFSNEGRILNGSTSQGQTKTKLSNE